MLPLPSIPAISRKRAHSHLKKIPSTTKNRLLHIVLRRTRDLSELKLHEISTDIGLLAVHILLGRHKESWGSPSNDFWRSSSPELKKLKLLYSFLAIGAHFGDVDGSL